jgi:hypothetical protein
MDLRFDKPKASARETHQRNQCPLSRQPPALVLLANRDGPPCPPKTRPRRPIAASSKVRGLAAPATRLPLPPSKRKPSGLTRGSSADFFGAIPVASALGSPAGRDPNRLCEHITRVNSRTPKPELSTWPGTGTFYLAPTDRGSVSRPFANPPVRPGLKSKPIFAGSRISL